MSNYRKTMADALREMYPLDEGTIDKVKEIASKKQAMKIDGVMVDSFTASAISQIYDRVNDANKKKMDSLPITKLANLAFKMMQKNEFVPEEADLDEETQIDEATMSSSQIAALKKAYEPMRDKRISTSDGNKLSAMMDKVGKDKETLIQLFKADIPFVSQSAVTKLITKHNMKGAEINKLREEVEVELDEAKYTGKLMKNKSIVDYVKKQQEKNRKDVAKFGNKKVGAYGNEPRFDSGTGWIDMAADEIKLSSMSLNKRKDFDSEAEYEAIARKLGLDKFEPKLEEVDLDEGKMSQLHQYMQDKKSPEEIAKLMKLDVKTIKALMSSHHPEDVDEASAYADARRSMSKDKDFSRRDTADDDTGATDDDVRGASKNIIMQLRKAGNRASQGVEFGDGKKVQIPAQMAIAVQQKYNAMKRPADKEKFQARIGKSYKDMLSALKEELQPKKESILERMNRKIKENKHG
jgi:hypothetical protein